MPAAPEQLVQFARVILIPVADVRSADTVIPNLFVSQTVHNLRYKSPPAAPVLTQTSPTHILTLFLLDPLKITLLTKNFVYYTYSQTQLYFTY